MGRQFLIGMIPITKGEPATQNSKGTYRSIAMNREIRPTDA